jgi:hypothetical protein
VGGLEGDAEGEDVVFCGLDNEVIFFPTIKIWEIREMSDAPRAGSREAAGASAGSRR